MKQPQINTKMILTRFRGKIKTSYVGLELRQIYPRVVKFLLKYFLIKLIENHYN